MKKLLILMLVSCVFCLPTMARNNRTLHSSITDTIQNFGINKDTVIVSIKSVDTGKSVYALNDKMLTNPASVQKVLTTPVSFETLGTDYIFTTELLQRDKNSFVIKLGADPYLNSKDLKELMGSVPRTTTAIYIDDTVLDKKMWGEGWQWDDDMNKLMPKFSSYNLDKNLIRLTVIPQGVGIPALIVNHSRYPLVFFNNVKYGTGANISVTRESSVSENAITISGTVDSPTDVFIPCNKPQEYFEAQLRQILEKKKVYLPIYRITRARSTDVVKYKIEHPASDAINDILKNSDNMIAETVFKLAGAKYLGIETGTDSAGIKMFNDYCKRNNLDNSSIRITDASGVSKNNLVSADFITEFLLLNKDNEILKNMARPGEGTLLLRLLPLKDKLRAKTGTLSNVSSIAGYITSKSGKEYVFCIITNAMELTESEKKMMEDNLLKDVYLKL